MIADLRCMNCGHNYKHKILLLKQEKQSCFCYHCDWENKIIILRDEVSNTIFIEDVVTKIDVNLLVKDKEA